MVYHYCWMFLLIHNGVPLFIFDNVLGTYAVCAVLCLCHLLDNSVECYTLWPLFPDDCVWWYRICHIHHALHDATIYLCHLLVTPYVATLGMCHLPVVHRWLYTTSPLSVWCHVWCYAVCFHLLDNHTSCSALSPSSLWWPPVTVYSTRGTSPWMHIMLYYDYIITWQHTSAYPVSKSHLW